MAQCKAKSKRSGVRCKKDAVIGGEVCHIHGGKTPKGVDSPQYIHGRYSKTLPQQIRAKIETDASDPLDLLPELQVQRALFSEYLNRFQDPISPPQEAIYALQKWADDIGKMVERIVRMKNETALTKAEVAFIVARIPEVVSRYVDDPEKQRQFISELFGVVGGVQPSHSELAASTAPPGARA